jgi:prepilin-type processing-associated H-X9-DG protein
MSAQMNGNTGSDANGPQVLNQYGGSQNYFIFRKQAEIVHPGASMTWVFIDEHPDSINDALFRVVMNANTWADWPASNHGKSGALSFADGHAEIHRWTDPVISDKPVAHITHGPLGATSPYTDLLWLQQRTTALP